VTALQKAGIVPTTDISASATGNISVSGTFSLESQTAAALVPGTVHGSVNLTPKVSLDVSWIGLKVFGFDDPYPIVDSSYLSGLLAIHKTF